MPTPTRRLAGCAALAVGLGYLAAAAAAPAPEAAVKKAIESDTAALSKLLNDGKPEKGAYGTIKPLALMLAAYGKQTGNDALVAEAVKVAEAANKATKDKKKDFAPVAAAAKGLASPKGGSPLKGAVHEQAGLDLDGVMAPFRPAAKGGLNLEADIKAVVKGGPIDPAAAQLLGVRSAVLADFTAAFPNDEVKTPADKAKWKKYSDDMLVTSQQLATEGAKGKSAEPKALSKAVKGIDGSCVNCHNDFRK